MAALALLPVSALLAGCGSSGGSSSSSATTATTATCAFNGATTPTTVAAAPVSPTTLTGVVPQAIGCTDQLTFNFSPAIPVASLAYGTGSSGATQLVLTFGGPGPNGTAASNVVYGGPSTVSTRALGHITSIDVKQGSGGAVVVTLGLPSQRPFATSTQTAAPIFLLTVG